MPSGAQKLTDTAKMRQIPFMQRYAVTVFAQTRAELDRATKALTTYFSDVITLPVPALQPDIRLIEHGMTKSLTVTFADHVTHPRAINNAVAMGSVLLSSGLRVVTGAQPAKISGSRDHAVSYIRIKAHPNAKWDRSKSGGQLSA